MKIYNAEIDCFNNLAKKLEETIDGLKSQSRSNDNLSFQIKLCKKIDATRQALDAANEAKKLLKRIEM